MFKINRCRQWRHLWPFGILAAVGALLFVCGFAMMAAPDKSGDMYSDHMILVDLDSGEIVKDEDSTQQIYPASLTKMMTAVVSIEMLGTDGLERVMEMPEDVFEMLKVRNASVAGFAPGELLTARDMLYGMMLPSGADGALGLAINLCGSEADFVARMNQKAQTLGMTQTHFANVTGLHEDGHYSTLRDLSVLLEYALKNEMFRKIFTTSLYETSQTPEHPQGLVLESTLFGKMSVAALDDLALLGGKTGFTDEAGLCLATLASCNHKEYILITAGAKARTSANSYHIIDAMKVYSDLKDQS